MNGGMAMRVAIKIIKRALQNPEVKAEYDALQPEYDIIQAMIDARAEYDTKDLSAKTRNYAGRYKPVENGKKSQPEYGKKNLHMD